MYMYRTVESVQSREWEGAILNGSTRSIVVASTYCTQSTAAALPLLHQGGRSGERELEGAARRARWSLGSPRAERGAQPEELVRGRAHHRPRGCDDGACHVPALWLWLRWGRARCPVRVQDAAGRRWVVPHGCSLGFVLASV